MVARQSDERIRLSRLAIGLSDTRANSSPPSGFSRHAELDTEQQFTSGVRHDLAILDANNRGLGAGVVQHFNFLIRHGDRRMVRERDQFLRLHVWDVAVNDVEVFANDGQHARASGGRAVDQDADDLLLRVRFDQSRVALERENYTRLPAMRLAQYVSSDDETWQQARWQNRVVVLEVEALLLVEGSCGGRLFGVEQFGNEVSIEQLLSTFRF